MTSPSGDEDMGDTAMASAEISLACEMDLLDETGRDF